MQLRLILSAATVSFWPSNPGSTTINYSLPQKFTTAQIRITDKLGKTLNIYDRGKGTINIVAAILSSGAYQYSLYVNGKLVSTKKLSVIK